MLLDAIGGLRGCLLACGGWARLLTCSLSAARRAGGSADGDGEDMQPLAQALATAFRVPREAMGRAVDFIRQLGGDEVSRRLQKAGLGELVATVLSSVLGDRRAKRQRAMERTQRAAAPRAWGGSAWGSGASGKAAEPAVAAVSAVGSDGSRDRSSASVRSAARSQPNVATTAGAWGGGVASPTYEWGGCVFVESQGRKRLVRGVPTGPSAAAAAGATAGSLQREAPSVMERARVLGICESPPQDVDEAGRLAAVARARGVAMLDQGKLNTMLTWALDYSRVTDGRPFFVALQGMHDSETSARNWQSLDGLAEFIRAAGSRAKGREGRQVSGDYIQSLVGLAKSLREEDSGQAIVIPRPANSRAFKSMRVEDCKNTGQRDSKRALRALHFRILAERGYDRDSPAAATEWEMMVVAHNLLLRGGEVGRRQGKAFDPKRGFRWIDIEWRAPCEESGWRAWAVVWICPIKDQTGKAQKQPIVVAQAVPGCSSLAAQPACAYSALVRRWQREVGALPSDVRGAPHGKMLASHRMANTPVFTRVDGSAVDAGDVRKTAQRMAAACGEKASDFGAKSARVGGATDLRAAKGAAGKDMIMQRGRWNSDIADIYQRVLVDDQLTAAAAMSHASGADLESMLHGWSQPA